MLKHTVLLAFFSLFSLKALCVDIDPEFWQRLLHINYTLYKLGNDYQQCKITEEHNKQTISPSFINTLLSKNPDNKYSAKEYKNLSDAYNAWTTGAHILAFINNTWMHVDSIKNQTIKYITKFNEQNAEYDEINYSNNIKFIAIEDYETTAYYDNIYYLSWCTIL